MTYPTPKRRALLRRLTAAGLSALLLFVSCPALSGAAAETADDGEVDIRSNSFYNYLQSIASYPLTGETILLDAAEGTLSSENAARSDRYLDQENAAVLEEDGFIEWTFSVPEDAVYCLSLQYACMSDDMRNPQAEFLVDGKTPYDSAAKLELKKLWTDSVEERYDERNNQLSYETSEVKAWQDIPLRDNEGLMNTVHRVYLTRGGHTIRLHSLRDTFAVKAMTLSGLKEPPSYAELKAGYDAKGYEISDAPLEKFQAEKMSLKSDQQIVAVSDRSNPAVEPYNVSKIRLNTMGGESWNKSGQWVEYSFTVPKDGLYALSFKFKQSLQIGMATCRNIYIDGEIPCQEFRNVRFAYSVKWQNMTVSDEEGNPCRLYLEAGTTHTLRMECTPGVWSELLQRVDDQYYSLASLYRQIIMVTSSDPDTLRDYNLDKQIDNLIPNCTAYSQALYECADEFDRLNGAKASQSETLRRMADQLQTFAEKPETIASRLKDFRDNLSGISNWLLTMKTQPLVLDYYMLSGDVSALPKPTASLWASVQDFFLGFLASFTEDYNSIGMEQEDAIEVWVNAGRDYANIVKYLIDDKFTPETGIRVNLSMVQGVIVEATLAGSGPEVCLEEARGYPVNLASRGAMVDLSQFEGFEEVLARYPEGAAIPYEYNGGCYALPQSLSYFVMFYRTDIFRQLGLSVPQTWTEFMDTAKLLQRKNMDVCLPYNGVSAQNSGDGGIGAKDIFSTLLLQMGGSFYNDDMTASGLDQDEALNAFKMWTDFYAKYNYPLTMDFNSRFRTGDVPLGVLNYNTYCTLAAAAPEIRGLWEMTLVPGVEGEDGVIDRTVGATGSAMSIFRKAAENGHEELCWKFLEWFSRDDIQYEYASRIEAVQGEAGRYCAANENAFRRLSWTTAELEVLTEQRGWIQEVPEVPGSYYVSRCLDNAFRSVIYRDTNPRDTLDKQNKLINEELVRKHEELTNRNS